MRYRSSGSVSRTLFIALILIAGAAALAVFFLRRPESTPALRGEAIARELGCFGCHGPEGKGGVADPGSRNGLVPGWDHGTVATLATDEEEILEWILDGIPGRLQRLPRSQLDRPIVPMPGYRGRISDQDLSDLVAYFRAVSVFGVDIPEPAYEGWKIAERLGCFGCHGPSGIGGVPNPGSFKGHIPPWDGDEFLSLVRNDDEFREWTLEGKIQRLWENPVARHFLENQIIQMPAYRDHISEDEMNQLTAFLRWMRSEKPPPTPASAPYEILGQIEPPLSP